MPKKTTRKTTRKTKIKTNQVDNGLSDIFGTGGPESQLSQTGTLEYNTRWDLISNNRQLLSEIYTELGLVQTVVDVPVDDAFRGGINIKTAQLDDEEIEQLNLKMERENDLNILAQSAKWTRLFGGGAVIIMTNQDHDQPLSKKDLKDDDVEFRAVDLWELTFDYVNYTNLAPDLQMLETEYFSYYGEKIHRSRVLYMKGVEPPSIVRPRLRGWGASIIEAMVRSINQFLKSTDLTFEVLDEFKVDVFRLDGLANTLMSQNGNEKVRKRVQTANQMKNFLHALVLDKEDEYEQKQLQFTGISDVMQGIRMQLATDLRMPMTKLFGISAAGFNAGEDDIENYNSMVESQIRAKVKFNLIKMIEVRCMQLFGYVPDDLTIEFEPLRIMSSEQEELVKTQKFNRLLSARQSGEITTDEFREACNKDALLPMKLEDDVEIPTDDKGESEEVSTPEVPTPQSETKPKNPESPKEAK